MEDTSSSELSIVCNDLLDHEPSKAEKLEWKLARKPPSEWLRLLCTDWAVQNRQIVIGTDLKFLAYKSYLKGQLTSQLLCRLSVIPEKDGAVKNFWKKLGVEDEFDRHYIAAQIEKFSSLYNILQHKEEDSCFDENKKERREAKAREREAALQKKVAEKAAREASREEQRRRKLEQRSLREKRQQEQKEAALRRAAELVQSNRVPIEITRGHAVATAKANAAIAAASADTLVPKQEKKARSSIIVSTASDLQQIVTHSRNLWAKYNAIAKEHNQKVNWITVAKELGIHVKVREKYARMHARAQQRGFNFETCGHYKIKDHPQIFLEPTSTEYKVKIDSPSEMREIESQPKSTSTNNETPKTGVMQTIQGLNNKLASLDTPSQPLVLESILTEQNNKSNIVSVVVHDAKRIKADSN